MNEWMMELFAHVTLCLHLLFEDQRRHGWRPRLERGERTSLTELRSLQLKRCQNGVQTRREMIDGD